MSSSPAASPSSSAAALPPSSSLPPLPPASSSPPPLPSSPPAPPAASAPSPVSSPPPPPSSSPPPPPPPAAAAPSPSTVSFSPPPPPPTTQTAPSPPSPSPPSTSSSSPPPPSTAQSSPSTGSLSSPPPPPSSTRSPSSTSISSSSPSSPSSSSSISGSALVGVGIAGLLAVSFIVLVIYCLCRKKKRKARYNGPPGGLPAHAIYKDSYYGPNPRSEWGGNSSANSTESILKPPPPPPPPLLLEASPRRGSEYESNSGAGAGGALINSKSWFTYEELEAATGGFSRANMLGEGGFGCVYKGTLADGQLVAVKQLKAGASQGEKEFQAEVEIISRVHHRHLVSLVGYCISQKQRLLVYDYVPNGTLEFHLHKNRGRSRLDWPTRLKIGRGAARGLAYLHEDCHPRIIHRDIKSSNILLDDKFEAQVSDFGLAKLSSDANTHISTRVMGTFGYLAPEYASTGKLTEKSDVFSFGVVLLELVTGRRPVDASQPMGQESLVEWARPILGQINSEEDLDMVVDPNLGNDYEPKHMLCMIEAAAACVRHSANRRPSMGQIVRALEFETSDLRRGLRPGQSQPFGSFQTSMEYEQNEGSYSVEMRRFKKLAMGSEEFDDRREGNMSSEYQQSRSREMQAASAPAGASWSSSSSAGSNNSTEKAVSKQQHEQQMAVRQQQQQRPANSVRKNYNSWRTRNDYSGAMEEEDSAWGHAP